MNEDPPQESQAQMMQRIAREDLERRRTEISPQVDANIAEVLKVCGQRLNHAGEGFHRNVDWDAEYNFWHKIISQEVERLRFNEGYEPMQVDLYPTTAKSGPAFMGKTQVGHVRFRVEGKWHYDSLGNKILRVTILKDPQ